MDRQCVITVGGYEGTLNGMSLGSYTPVDRVKGKVRDLSKELKEPATEYSFTASQNSITCADGCQNLLAVGGYDEVIRLFDVYKKKDLGDLMGVHEGTITSLQIY